MFVLNRLHDGALSWLQGAAGHLSPFSLRPSLVCGAATLRYPGAGTLQTPLAEWCLNCAGPCTTKGAVCVAEAGPLDLLLTMRSKAKAGSGDDKRLGLEIEFSGGQVHLMTCADSFVALRDIILYLALDGDSQHSGHAGDAESRQQTTPPSVSG